MKARVKATGEIVDIEFSHYIADVAWYKIKGQALYSENELKFMDEPDYWTRLEHQAAIAAMQGLLMNEHIYFGQDMSNALDAFISTNAAIIAQALVDELKEKEERK